MGVTVSEKINVLSKDFQETFKEVVDELNRVSEAYADLQRVRAEAVVDSGSIGVKAAFFVVEESSDDPIKPIELEDLPSGYQTYNGSVFEIFMPTPKTFQVVNSSNVIGIDLGITENPPNTMPEAASIIGPDQLDVGTVVQCQDLGNGHVVFSSVMPRLSVECL
tara:strand:+ start:113 stop:604 length:492 start_codon:yes stop_codon:yes gene_type:complete